MQTYQAINWQGRQLKQYHVLRLLKRDRLGTLWLAEESQERHPIALRLLPSIAADVYDYMQAFSQIALASSSLEHPHILPVLDSGVQEGNQNEAIPYLVYPYLEQATTLHAHLQRSGGKLPALEALRHLSQAAQALDYAHSQQVVHGGIQPTCLLLDGTRLLLTDFCLASLLNSDITLSRTYSIDLPYLAPEQVQGRTEPASDFYSLATIAYQIFAGRLPFEGRNSPYELLLQQLTQVPPAPGRFNPVLSQHMEEVLLKALSRQPQQRYASCSELVNTLERAWKGLPLNPLDDPNATLLAAWSKSSLSHSTLTQPTMSMPFSPPASPLPALTSSAAAEKNSMPPMRITPEIPPEMTDETTTIVPPQEEARKGRLSRRTMLIGGASVAVLAAGSAALLTLWRRPQHFSPSKPLVRLTAHQNVVTNVAWDSSGRYIASASQDTHVMLWDVSSTLQQKPDRLQVISQPIHKWKFLRQIELDSLHWTSSGHQLIVSKVSGGVFNDQLFATIDAFSNQDTRQMYSDNSLSRDDAISTSYYEAVSAPHSDLLAAIASRVDTNTFQIQDKVQLWREHQPSRPVASLPWNPLKGRSFLDTERLTTIGWSCDGTMIASLTSNLNLIIWDAKTHAIRKTIKLPYRKQKYDTPNVQAVLLKWSPVDPHIVAVTVIETIVLVDVRTGKALDVLSTDDKNAYTRPQTTTDFPNWVPQVLCFTWSPDGRYIVACYFQQFNTITVWDLQKKQVKKDKAGGHVQDYLFPPPGSFNTHSASIFDLSWSPDGRYLASASGDKTILIWQVEDDA
jgi:serine/threonine protein kinase/WD40 repeat protein